MKLEKSLENILNNINTFINIDNDRQKYTAHCDNLKNKLFDQLREDPEFSYLFSGFQLGGSYGDNVKVAKPDEFDIIFHIKFPEQSLIDVEKDPKLPGNVLLNFTRVLDKIKDEEQHKNHLYHLKRWLDKDKYLIVGKLQRFIGKHFNLILRKMNHCIIFNGETAELRYSRQGPAHTIIVIQSYDFNYSIDFVPGILLNEEQSVIAIKGQWEAIPKPSKTKMPNYNSFRASYYQQEHEIIENKKQLKNTLRIMKKFRDMHLGKKVKSYYIKTLFLHKTNKEPASYWEKPLQEILMDMFKELEESFVTKKLPFFWDNNLNLYQDISNKINRQWLHILKITRERMEKAAVELTLPIQRRIYRIFLLREERMKLQMESGEQIIAGKKKMKKKKKNRNKFKNPKYKFSE